jgi:hypothetical protein
VSGLPPAAPARPQGRTSDPGRRTLDELVDRLRELRQRFDADMDPEVTEEIEAIEMLLELAED